MFQTAEEMRKCLSLGVDLFDTKKKIYLHSYEDDIYAFFVPHNAQEIVCDHIPTLVSNGGLMIKESLDDASVYESDWTTVVRPNGMDRLIDKALDRTFRFEIVKFEGTRDEARMLLACITNEMIRQQKPSLGVSVYVRTGKSKYESHEFYYKKEIPKKLREELEDWIRTENPQNNFCEKYNVLCSCASCSAPCGRCDSCKLNKYK